MIFLSEGVAFKELDCVRNIKTYLKKSKSIEILEILILAFPPLPTHG
jgi:hypothetical protein